MRLAHFASDTAEYVVLIEDGDDVYDYEEYGYGLESDSEIQFHGDAPEHLPVGYPLRLDDWLR